ncbi:MAG: PTS lactose/cellobiose transporter subunit IIA [Pygmaiobacter sp.]|nr:PTS lactose/cellobiose transporter subunit IIA [Pygmaiobacter sp.]
MIENELFEDISMTIIANAGACKSNSFEAIHAAKVGDFEGADNAMRQAKEYVAKAQVAHAKLLQLDAQGKAPAVDILLTHAQDHFMMATLAQDMALELIDVYKAIKQKA